MSVNRRREPSPRASVQHAKATLSAHAREAGGKARSRDTGRRAGVNAKSRFQRSSHAAPAGALRQPRREKPRSALRRTRAAVERLRQGAAHGRGGMCWSRLCGGALGSGARRCRPSTLQRRQARRGVCVAPPGDPCVPNEVLRAREAGADSAGIHLHGSATKVGQRYPTSCETLQDSHLPSTRRVPRFCECGASGASQRNSSGQSSKCAVAGTTGQGPVAHVCLVDLSSDRRCAGLPPQNSCLRQETLREVWTRTCKVDEMLCRGTHKPERRLRCWLVSWARLL